MPFDVSCRPLDDDTHKSRSISFSPHLHENHVKSLHWQAFGLGVKGVAAATQKERCKGDNFCLRYLGSQGPGTFVSLAGIRPCGLGSYCPSLWHVLTSTTDPKWRAQTVTVRHLSNGLARLDLRREAAC